MFGAIASVICDSGVTLFGVMADNKRIYGQRGPSANIMDATWTLLLERYGLFVRLSGGDVAGHVVSDKAGGADMQQIHALVSGSMRRRNPMSGVRTNLVAGIEFVDSMESLLVQAADIAAYILSRHANGDERFGWMARLLLGRMWVSADGRQRGWKVV